MISVFLVGPEHPGNIGAVARVMANFGVRHLNLVSPGCDHLGEEALNRASHAKDILKGTKISEIECISRYDMAVGFTSVLGTDYNLLRTPVPLKSFSASFDRSKSCALVFGRESSGLSNEELQVCDITVSIETEKDYPAMNLSHAVAVVLHQLYDGKVDEGFPPAGKYLDVMNEKIESIFAAIDFSSPEKRITQVNAWKRVMAKSQMTRREAFVLLGGMRKLSELIRNKGKNQ